VKAVKATRESGSVELRARSVAPVSKSAPGQILGKSAVFEIGTFDLAGADFETGATERALSRAEAREIQIFQPAIRATCPDARHSPVLPTLSRVGRICRLGLGRDLRYCASTICSGDQGAQVCGGKEGIGLYPHQPKEEAARMPLMGCLWEQRYEDRT
jgi:hypothetical protein